jgi:hypothetical protein
MGTMQTVLKKKPSCHKYGCLAFLLGKKDGRDENYRTHHRLELFYPHCFWVFILFVTIPSWAAGFCTDSVTSSVNEPAKAISNEEAVNIAKEYLNIKNTINYKIKIEEKVIAADTFNAYKILEPGINRLCWVVTLIVPDAFGAGRTVFVDKENGEILGGYSSK